MPQPKLYLNPRLPPLPPLPLPPSEPDPFELLQGTLEGTITRPTSTERVTVEKTYSYPELDYENDIRILRICRGKKGDPLECIFIPSALQSAKSPSKSNCHEFCALSHRWGNDPPTHPVIIYDDARRQDGLQSMPAFNSSGVLYIRSNLAAALQQIRKENEDVNIWVDALCINQADSEEKMKQILRLSEIYSQASSLLVWLGVVNQESKEATDIKHLMDPNVLGDLVMTKARVKKWMLIINLTKSELFNRMWLVQELGSARKIVLCWDSEQMQWSDFTDATAVFTSKFDETKEILGDSYYPPELIRRVRQFSSWISREVEESGPRNQGAKSTNSTSKHESSEPSPKIMSNFEDNPGAESTFLLDETYESDSDCSHASLHSSSASTIASSATSISDMAPIARDSATEVANLISDDHQLRELLDHAFGALDAGKVTRNFRRVLRSFSQDLTLESTTQLQEQVAKFVGQRSRHIAALVRENFRPSGHLELPNSNFDIVRNERMQQYVGQFQTGFTINSTSPPGEDVPGDDDTDESDEGSEDHPDLARLREWFLSTDAMQNLRDRFRGFLYPEKRSTLENCRDRADNQDLETRGNDQQVQIQPPGRKNDIFQDQNDEYGDRNSFLMEDRLLSAQPLAFVLSSASSILWNYILPKKPLAPEIVRLEWTCNCGHISHDDFRELRPGAVADYAAKLVQSGYVTRAQPTHHASGATATFIIAARNKVAAVSRNIPGFKPGKRGQSSKSNRRKFAEIQCSPTPGITCRWLHLCLKPRPNAKVTKLEPLHICKDDDAKDLTDATFFRALQRAWKAQRTWTELILFKLTRIEFIKFSAFPDDSVDRIVADMVPQTTEHYEFAPPPPLEMVPPIAAEHMVHLLLSECTPSMQHSSFYLEQLPKKKDKPLKFAVGATLSQDINIGYGLRFIEKPDPSFIATFLFVIAIVVGTVFGVFWTVFKKDLQDAWTVAAYIVSVAALAVVTWQIRATS